MAQSHTWFATNTDAKLIVSWLHDAGTVASDVHLPDGDLVADGRELILHFPRIGPLVLWPEQIRPSDYEEGTERWRKAIIADRLQNECPKQRQVDSDRSAVAGLRLPELRDGQHWVSGCVWFPGSRLSETFPELARVCQRFERFVRSFPTVFAHPKQKTTSTFDYQLCMTSAVQRVVALPEAFALLEGGAFMMDHRTSPENYRKFRRRLQLSGHLPLE